jgi:hypothetical protein
MVTVVVVGNVGGHIVVRWWELKRGSPVVKNSRRMVIAIEWGRTIEWGPAIG